MIQESEIKPKIALCRKCYGTGKTIDKDSGETHTCPQCEGSGRVTVSARMTYDIRPYKPKDRQR